MITRWINHSFPSNHICPLKWAKSGLLEWIQVGNVCSLLFRSNGKRKKGKKNIWIVITLIAFTVHEIGYLRRQLRRCNLETKNYSPMLHHNNTTEMISQSIIYLLNCIQQCTNSLLCSKNIHLIKGVGWLNSHRTTLHHWLSFRGKSRWPLIHFE